MTEHKKDDLRVVSDDDKYYPEEIEDLKEVSYPEEIEDLKEVSYPEEAGETVPVEKEVKEISEPEADIVTEPGEDKASEPEPDAVRETAEPLLRILPDGNLVFGRYAQGKEREVKPLVWRVLRWDEKELLLISDRVLAYRPYRDRDEENNWESCSLRRWLNDDFLNHAFNDQEQKVILEGPVYADRNDVYNTPQGNNTCDKVFLLSMYEAKKYFRKDLDRLCRPSAWVKASADWDQDHNGYCHWWLRTTGGEAYRAAAVDTAGCINSLGYYASRGVRPVIRVSLPSNGNDPLTKIIRKYMEPEMMPFSKKEDIIRALPGAKITFGRYMQGEDYEVEPIVWRVLDKSEKGILLLSEYGLRCMAYYSGEDDVSWAGSDIRYWLNHGFLDTAFTYAEQKMIRDTEVPEEDRAAGTKDREISDKVFLLSGKEAEKYLASDEDKVCILTPLWQIEDIDRSDWWLRTMTEKYLAWVVTACGDIDCYGEYLNRCIASGTPGLVAEVIKGVCFKKRKNKSVKKTQVINRDHMS